MPEIDPVVELGRKLLREGAATGQFCRRKPPNLHRRLWPGNNRQVGSRKRAVLETIRRSA